MKECNDRVATGQPSVNPYGSGHVAQSGVYSPSRFMAGMLRVVLFVRHGNGQNVPNRGSHRGYTLGYCQHAPRWYSSSRCCFRAQFPSCPERE